MDIQSLLNEISENKASKRTDKQLAHLERLNVWRNTPSNKQLCVENGKSQRKYSEEQVQRLRVMFWEEGKSLQNCLDYLGFVSNLTALKKVLKNKTYVDPNFKWDVTLYTQKVKEQRTIRTNGLTEQQIDILNGMDSLTFENKYGFNGRQWSDRRRWLRSLGYEVPKVLRRDSRLRKGLVD